MLSGEGSRFRACKRPNCKTYGADLSSLYWFSPAALIDRVVVIDVRRGEVAIPEGRALGKYADIHLLANHRFLDMVSVLAYNETFHLLPVVLNGIVISRLCHNQRVTILLPALIPDIIKFPAVLFRVFFLGTVRYIQCLERIIDNSSSIFLAISLPMGLRTLSRLEILADAERRYAMAMARLWGV